MNKLFYPKLAANNIKKNSKTYVPYIITCIITVAMFYIMKSLSMNESIDTLKKGANTIRYTMEMGSWVAAIFAVVFLFYTNSFLMKRRKREFGLFNILGMEKRHISKVIAFESLYIALASLVIGIGLGIVFDKLMYLLLSKIIGGGYITLGFSISLGAIVTSVILFAVIFLLIFLNSLRQIHLSNPIELLKSKSVGEKEPKAKVLIAIIGLLCLAGGYYISLTTKVNISTLLYFFVAVILVIIGTYLLFSAGSIVLLKLLKSNKRYYYKTKHFISISGLIYRMKQNAVGLANICILSTMVLVMISSTTSLILGVDDVLMTNYPHEITVFSYYFDEASESAKETPTTINEQLCSDVLKEITDDNNLEITNKISFTYLGIAAVMHGSEFITDNNRDLSELDNVNNLFFFPLSDYNAITGSNKTLGDGEILLYSTENNFNYNTLEVFDKQYRVKEKVDDFAAKEIPESKICSSQFIVVKDMNEIEYVYNNQLDVYEMPSRITDISGFDFNGSDEEKLLVGDSFRTEIFNQISESEDDYSISVSCRAENKESLYSLYGGFFFLGVFLGTLFLMATILIIYYKQISEGYEDKERYEIMQKVGVSKKDMKKSIHSQILTVFFLPLITAGIHTAFAFPIITKIMKLLFLPNTTLTMICTICCFLVFAVLYAIIYAVTAKAYYRIVNK